MNPEKFCSRCGRCCHVVFENKIIKCPFLILKGKIGSCRIYPNRIGKLTIKIAENKYFKCIYRKDSEFDYKNCPNNTNKKILEVGY